METHVFTLNPQEPTLKKRAISVLYLGGTFFVLMFGWKFFWPTSTERNLGVMNIMVEAGIVSLLWGLAMAFYPKRSLNYKLLVDDESITCVMDYTGWMKWLVMRRTIRRGKVRSIWEIRGRLGMPGGMGLSERSRLRAWMFGFVFLPRTLPAYESLRMLAESWRTRDGVN